MWFFKSLPFLLKIKTFVFSVLTVRCHFSQYNFNLSNEFCRPVDESEKSTMSSANIRQFNLVSKISTGSHEASNIKDRSAKYKLIRVGLNTQHCLTHILVPISLVNPACSLTRVKIG